MATNKFFLDSEYRYFSYFVDRLIFFLVFFLFVAVIDDKILVNYLSPDIRESIRLNGFFLFFIIYFLGQELLFQTTIGKAIFGLKVVSIDDSKVSVKAIIIRNLCRLIPFDTFSYLFKIGKNGFHDKIAKTDVIKDLTKSEINIKINNAVSVTLLSRKNRFWSYVLDRVIIIFWFFVFKVFMGELLLTDLPLDSVQMIYVIGFIVIYFCYFFVQEVFAQTSFAKKIYKAKVVNKKGLKPSFKQLLIRNLVRLIPFDTFSYAFDKRGFHDKISKTYVVTEVNKSQ